MSKKALGATALILFIVIAGGLLWLAIQSGNAVSALLSFAAGLSMIFLPCTLPLALVIVPIAAREDRAGRGLGLAVAFGLGLAVTLTIYGVATALLGGYFGLDQFSRAMFVFAGLAALLFGLTELELFHVPLPELTSYVPNWVKEGYFKTFLLGLFLGNAGVGCPNPAFYVLLTYIASTGSAAVGGWLGLVHGLGRATPLIFLVVLAILGIKSSDWISKVSKRISIWTGVGLVLVGAFILTYGLFGMHWWEDSVFHAGWNQLMMSIDPALAEKPDHPVAKGVWESPQWAGWWSLVLFTLIPLIWFKIKKGIKSTVFWILALLLISLGVLTSTGIITVKHGHGLSSEDSQNHAHPQKVPKHNH
ncbi:MAG: cytochrome c biogenesis CcdA family protein [Candidatus Magasanikbacteria bacterium]